MRVESRQIGGLDSTLQQCQKAIVPDHGGLLVGRREECGLRLHSPTVSGLQCKLAWGPQGMYYLEDLSSNGTFVNETKVGKGNKLDLVDGDIIQLTSRRLDELQYRFRCANLGGKMFANPLVAEDIDECASPEVAAASSQAPTFDVGLAALQATLVTTASEFVSPALVAVAVVAPAFRIRGAASAGVEATCEAERTELLAARRQLRCEVAEMEAIREQRRLDLESVKAATRVELEKRRQLAEERDKAMEASAQLAGEMEALRTVIGELEDDAQTSLEALRLAAVLSNDLKAKLAALRRDTETALSKQKHWELKASRQDEHCVAIKKLALTLAQDLRYQAKQLADQLGAGGVTQSPGVACASLDLSNATPRPQPLHLRLAPPPSPQRRRVLEAVGKDASMVQSLGGESLLLISEGGDGLTPPTVSAGYTAVSVQCHSKEKGLLACASGRVSQRRVGTVAMEEIVEPQPKRHRPATSEILRLMPSVGEPGFSRGRPAACQSIVEEVAPSL